jgi:hypothetical protein
MPSITSVVHHDLSCHCFAPGFIPSPLLVARRLVPGHGNDLLVLVWMRRLKRLPRCISLDPPCLNIARIWNQKTGEGGAGKVEAA